MKLSSKDMLIGALAAMLIWFGSAVVRLENQRYALELELCGRFDASEPNSLIKRDECLQQVQTRTGAFYNLLYGLDLI